MAHGGFQQRRESESAVVISVTPVLTCTEQPRIHPPGQLASVLSVPNLAVNTAWQKDISARRPALRSSLRRAATLEESQQSCHRACHCQAQFAWGYKHGQLEFYALTDVKGQLWAHTLQRPNTRRISRRSDQVWADVPVVEAILALNHSEAPLNIENSPKTQCFWPLDFHCGRSISLGLPRLASASSVLALGLPRFPSVSLGLLDVPQTPSISFCSPRFCFGLRDVIFAWKWKSGRFCCGLEKFSAQLVQIIWVSARIQCWHPMWCWYPYCVFHSFCAGGHTSHACGVGWGRCFTRHVRQGRGYATSHKGEADSWKRTRKCWLPHGAHSKRKWNMGASVATQPDTCTSSNS